MLSGKADRETGQAVPAPHSRPSSGDPSLPHTFKWEQRVRGEGSETRPDRQQRDFRDSRENRQEFRAFPNKQRSDKARLVPRPLDTLGLAWGRILVKEEGTQDAREAGPRESRSRSSTGGYVGGGVHTGEGLFSGLCLVLRQGLWVALVIPELCTLGWSWTQKSSLLF